MRRAQIGKRPKKIITLQRESRVPTHSISHVPGFPEACILSVVDFVHFLDDPRKS